MIKNVENSILRDECVTAVENSILRDMCGNDSDKYPGFFNIVNKLVDTGSCVTTISASDIDFFCMNSFIAQRPYEAGVDLIELSFNRDEVVGGAEFKRRLEYKKKTMASELVELQEKLDIVKSQYETICVILGEE
jgi:hypothetical protein